MKSLAVGLASVMLALTMSGCDTTEAKPVAGVGALRARVQISAAANAADVTKVTVRIASSDPADPVIAPLVLDTAAANGTYVGVFLNLRTSTNGGPTYDLVAEATDAADKVLYRGTANDVVVTEGVMPTVIIVANSTDPVVETDPIPVRITSVTANDVVRSGEKLTFKVTYNTDATAPVEISWQQLSAADETAAFSAPAGAITEWTAPTTTEALTETISISVSNGLGPASVVTFNVLVTAKIDVPVEVQLNDPPVIDGMMLSRPRIEPFGSVVLTVTASDPNLGNSLKYAFTRNTCTGAFSGAVDGVAQDLNSATFTADGAFGLCKLKVTVSDQDGLTAIGLVSVVVDPEEPTRIFTVTPTAPYTLANTAGIRDDGAPGFESGSIRAAIAAPGSKAQLNFAPARLFGRSITLGDIAEVSYFTKKATTHDGSGPEVHDWYLQIYTAPYADQTDGRWYGARVGAEPYLSANRVETAGTWNRWSSSAAVNQLRFFDSALNNYFGGYADPTWTELLARSSAVAAGRPTSVPYAGQPVLYITLQTASSAPAGLDAQLDGLRIKLTDGTVTVIDFQPQDAAEFTVTTASPVNTNPAGVVGVADDGAPGFEGGSFAASGTPKAELHFTPSGLFGHEITIGDIARMSFFTKKGTTYAVDPIDWYLTLYTEKYPGQTSGWYGARLSTEPCYSSNINAPANTWNLWSTDGATNQLRFFESTYNYFGSSTDSTWAELLTESSLSGAGPRISVPYAEQQVRYVTMQTGSGAVEFEGQVDGLEIELKDGALAIIDFEP
jgi:hypothetical protein